MLTLATPKIDDLVYACVMGRAGEFKSIAIYIGEEVHTWVDMMSSEEPADTLIGKQDCMLCNFSSRDDTLPQNRKIIKEIGLSFRGEWISFESHKTGFVPYVLDIKQVKIMLDALRNFYMTFRAIIENGATADFEHGETLLRVYDEKAKLWRTIRSPLLIPKADLPVVKIDAKQAREEILTQPCNNRELEFDFTTYFPIPTRGEKGKPDVYPLALIIADHRFKRIMFSHLDYGDNYEKKAATVFLNMIEDIGRPKTVFVRNELAESVLSDICKKAKITLKVSPKLDAIDKFLLNFL